jgi:hypothetical protein
MKQSPLIGQKHPPRRGFHIAFEPEQLMKKLSEVIKRVER